MPDYKKRKHSRIFSPQKRAKKVRPAVKENNDIKMSPSRGSKLKGEPEPKMKVVKGKKLEQKRRLKVISVAVAVLILVVGILQLALPAGITETVSNAVSLIGSGSYPIELDSTDTLNTVSKDSYFYVLTNTHINAYTGSGKELFSYPHGFEKPVLKTSAARAIVFNQSGTQALIFNNNGLKATVNTEKDILTAAVSDSGSYAIATRSDKYNAAVTVYSKRGKQLYEWYSAENTVNNIALSPNGKKLAVASFNSSVGQYKSTVCVLNYKSADPEFTHSFEGTLVYSLDTTHRSGFSAVTAKGVKFIKWGKYKSTEYNNDYSIAFFKASKSGFTAVFNRESDKTDNRIAIFSKSGELKSEFTFKGLISDIEVFGGHIYCMSDTDIYLLGSDGEILRQASCGFGAVSLAVTNTNAAVVVTDNKIEKIKLEQETEK